MFASRKLFAFLVKALLNDDPALADTKPHVIALVPITDPLAVLGVALDVPTVVLVPDDPLDSRLLLASKLGAYEFLERLRVREAQFTRILGRLC
jgi:hypothetical protein